MRRALLIGAMFLLLTSVSAAVRTASAQHLAPVFGHSAYRSAANEAALKGRRLRIRIHVATSELNGD